MPVRRPLVVPGRADERAGDHAADRVLAGQDLARDPAALVELLERNRLFVRRDLEDRVRRRVDDPLARELVLFAELLDDLRARGRLVAEHAAAGLVHERVDHIVREPLRIGRERRLRDRAHQLPVPGGRVLALRSLEQAPGDGRGARLWRAALQRLDVPEPQCLDVREVEAAHRPRDVAERVGALVTVCGGIRKRSRAHGVQHNHASARHAAILGRMDVRPRTARPAGLHRVRDRTRRRDDLARRAHQPGEVVAPGQTGESGRTSSSGWNSRPCASATAWYVIFPSSTLTPRASARSRATASASP